MDNENENTEGLSTDPTEGMSPEEIMDFDPLAEVEDTSTAESESMSKSAPSDESHSPSVEDDPKPASPVASASPPTNQGTPETDFSGQMAAMQAQMQSMLQQNQALQQQVAQGVQASQAPATPTPPTELINSETMELLRSEDDASFKTGLTQLIQSAESSARQNIAQELYPQLAQAIQQEVGRSSQLTQSMQEIRNDFYSTYPTLDRPELRNVVQATAGQVMQELGTQQWSVAVRDLTASRVASLFPQAQTEEQAAPTKQTPNLSLAPQAPSQQRSVVNENSPESIASSLGL